MFLQLYSRLHRVSAPSMDRLQTTLDKLKAPDLSGAHTHTRTCTQSFPLLLEVLIWAYLHILQRHILKVTAAGGFPALSRGSFQPRGCCSDGIRGGLERVHVWSRAGPCSGDPPTSMLLSCLPATHSRCQAMEKMLQTFPGMGRTD